MERFRSAAAKQVVSFTERLRRMLLSRGEVGNPSCTSAWMWKKRVWWARTGVASRGRLPACIAAEGVGAIQPNTSQGCGSPLTGGMRPRCVSDAARSERQRARELQSVGSGTRAIFEEDEGEGRKRESGKAGVYQATTGQDGTRRREYLCASGAHSHELVLSGAATMTTSPDQPSLHHSIAPAEHACVSDER